MPDLDQIKQAEQGTGERAVSQGPVGQSRRPARVPRAVVCVNQTSVAPRNITNSWPPLLVRCLLHQRLGSADRHDEG